MICKVVFPKLLSASHLHISPERFAWALHYPREGWWLLFTERSIAAFDWVLDRVRYAGFSSNWSGVIYNIWARRQASLREYAFYNHSPRLSLISSVIWCHSLIWSNLIRLRGSWSNQMIEEIHLCCPSRNSSVHFSQGFILYQPETAVYSYHKYCQILIR